VIPENRIPTHPGVILAQEFLAPLGISQVVLLHISACRSRGPASWCVQTAYDLARSRPTQPVEPLKVAS